MQGTVTLLNKLKRKDSTTNTDIWYKTILTDCVYKKTSLASVTGKTVGMGQQFTILIPFTGKYIPYKDWKNLVDKTGFYTLSPSDVIILGTVEEDVNDKNIIIEDLEDIRESDPLQYDNLKRQDIHSLVVVPLYDDTKNIGFYGVDNPHEESYEYTQNFLQIMGHFIVSSLKRRNLLKQLQNMSYSDQLTKLGNRFAMERYLEETIKSGNLGVVYCDITGLKRVNDTNGHKAGDDLILRACDSLREVFGTYGLFRVGGDELLALCPQIEKHVLEQKTSLLRETALKNSVVLAVGSDWQEVTNRDIDKVLSVAEQRMYEDKALYYKKAQSNIAQ